MAKEDFLFNKVDWFSVERNKQNQLSTEILNMDGDRFLNTSTDDLCNYFEQKFRIDVPSLRENEIVADQNEVDIESHYQRRARFDRSGPSFIKGTKIEITIPFDGDAEVFNIQPSSFTYILTAPITEVRGQLLILRIQGRDLSQESVQDKIQSTISSINSNLNNLRKDVSGWNSRINNHARQQIENRKKKLLADRNLVASLGFPLKVRGGSSMTYTTPNVRRKINPTLPEASTEPFRPEPTLEMKEYENILKILRNMVIVIERSPNAFINMKEEDLRQHFLVQLNAQYEGTATGETFNYEGKTDILIRFEGKNLFIAECKFWKGEKALLDTIDQLLGYTSWRDTKTAILVFNRNKNLSSVLGKIYETVKSHSCYKRETSTGQETEFRYIFHIPQDKNREIHLTIMVFDVPE